ncbi:MAG: glycoside hydrolase family 9 protein [Bacteroidota bacterium]
MKKSTSTILITLLIFQYVTGQNALMQADMENALETVWQKKEMIDAEIIDHCESLDQWQGGGEASVSLSMEQYKEGNGSVIFSTPAISADGSAPYPTSYLVRSFDGANWERFNRISVWIYAEQENVPFVYLSMDLTNEGEERVPDRFRKKGRNFIKVETNRWNRILWEIPALPRDRVSSLAFVYTINGKAFSGVGDSVHLYLDQIELQKVEADYEEGWQVAPGKIAFSHTGYSVSGDKSALANGLDADDFSIIDHHSGEEVLSKKTEIISTRFGAFQYMDFSELQKAGEYRIRAGGITTPPFKISNKVWIETIRKNLNFWHAERCGEEVPGIHGNCHRDVCVEHDGKKIVVNGGWHDAGDLTQMIYNTADAAYAMIDLADALKSADTLLSQQLAEEARWGVDWILKTRFGKGWRHNFGGISKWTDGIIGTGDDLVFEAKNQPLENFLCASVLARAALYFNDSDPALSTSCLLSAKEDWYFAKEGISKLNVELCGTAVLASTHLFELTGDTLYKNSAVEWAAVLVNSQQKAYPAWEIPLTGFFYKSPDKRQVLRYNPIGNDQAPILALDQMVRLFPGHEQWMGWYTSIILYAEYIKRSAELSNPFQMIPQSIYHLDEIHTPSIYGFQQSTLAKYAKYEEKEPQYRQQVQNGLPLGGGNFLRTFPVWYSHRGSAGIQLAQAKGLAVASQLRNDQDGINLAEKQMQWLVGRNPFSQSTIYGEGYDFPPFYFVSSGPIVGSIACGIQTNGNSDVPNWPASAVYNYKEIWTHTAARWLMLMADFANGGLGDLREKASGESPGFEVSERILNDKEVEISLLVTDKAITKVELRGFNLSVDHAVKHVQLRKRSSKTLKWRAEICSVDKPWIALIIANDDMATKTEIWHNK